MNESKLVVSKIENTDFWQLESDFNCPISPFLYVPKFFVTDFASIPSFVKCWIDDDEKGVLESSIFHDYLYTTKIQGFDTRKQCDDFFYKLLIHYEVPYFKAQSIYWAVRLGGGSHFRTK